MYLKYIYLWNPPRLVNARGLVAERASRAHKPATFSKILKKCHFFTQKDHPASQETEVLHEKLKIVQLFVILKKKSRPPTSPNFYTHKKNFLHVFTYIGI